MNKTFFFQSEFGGSYDLKTQNYKLVMFLQLVGDYHYIPPYFVSGLAEDYAPTFYGTGFSKIIGNLI